MPEQTVIVSDLEQALDLLEDYTLDTHMLRSQNYCTVKNILDSGGNINGIIIERLLAVCIHDLKEDFKYTVVVLNIISLILKKIKAGECSSLPDVVPSAMAIINFIKITAKNKIETLQTLCFDTLLLYPDDALIRIATSFCTELMEAFNLYCRQCIPIELRIQPVKIISKFLKILPPDKRMIFVKNGLNIYFSKVIPTVILYVSTLNTVTSMPLEALEALTTELFNIDYSDNPQWHGVLECIYNPQKYPIVMKSLLESGSDIWHRLWIVFIKLLKNQITINNNKVGTPINSMLPVVEMAFKLDIVNRCRAFECWNVLIDNFSTETNEVLMNKRLKLLIVPLRSNNAKVEETVLAKLNSWWHLIRRFQSKMDKFSDLIVIPFLHFCFGKHVNSEKSIFVPGLLSDNTKKQCIHVFVEIVGHVNCSGCTNLPKLKKKIINEQLLVGHLSDWLFSLATVIKILIKDNREITKQQITCVWKSFILTISKLPENDFRKDFFNGLLGLLPQLVKDCRKDDGIFVILKLLLTSLYSEENKLLFTTKYKQNNSINSILLIMRDPILNNFYKSFPDEQSVTFLKPVTNYIVNELLLNSDHVTNNILRDLPTDDNTLLLWTSFAESMIESNYDKYSDNLCHMLLWPLKSLNSFIDVQYPSLVWNKIYNLWYPKLNKTSINSDILEILFNTEITSKNAHFLLCVFLALLKNEMENDNSNEIEKEAEYLLNVINKLPDCYFIEHTVTYSLMIDILITMLNKTTACLNVVFAKYTIFIVNRVLKLMSQGFKQEDMNILVSTKNLFTCIENLFKIEIFNHFKFLIVDNMIDCLQQSSLRKFALPILKTFKLTSKDEDILFYTKIESALKTFDTIIEINENDMNDNKFTTPDLVNKKAKKKDVNIVNTVVEDGEEYVVVKSNWKFNPKKLTENQREKLQRKREDIPALYQDLSQSQDDFKLTTWKTDSQDTSSTCSKSASKSSDQDVTTILKNIPNSNCVPKILENIFSDNVQKDIVDTVKDKTEYDTCKKIQQSRPVKTTKSNITLKDRVFRNVRNLIEKSVVQNDNKKIVESLNHITTENICETPLTKVNNLISLIHSAPSNISLDRPSRLKRKPKKFEDSEVFSNKKRRHSLNQNDLQLNSETSGKAVSNIPSISNITEENNCIENQKLSINEIETNIGSQENNDICSQVVEVKVDNSSFKNTCDSTNETKEILENIQNSECSKKSKAKSVTEEIFDATKVNIHVDVPESTQLMVQLPSTDSNISSSNVNEISSQKNRTKKVLNPLKSSTKKNTVKKSRIEKELAIDMVEGHPFLKTQSEKRLTRKCLSNIVSSSRRRCLTEKFENSKLDSKSITKSDKRSKETKDKSQKNTKPPSSSDSDIQDKCRNSSEELPLSEDVIESSQDSTLTTISVKSIKTTFKKVPLITLENIQHIIKNNKTISETQDLIENSGLGALPFNQNNEDIKLPQNHTVIRENSRIDLTENINTEPVNNEQFLSSGEVLVILDNESPIAISTDDTCITSNSQEIADADTELIEIDELSENIISNTGNTDTNSLNDTQTINIDMRSESKEINANIIDAQDDTAKNVSELTAVSIAKETSGVSSPLKGDDKRKKEFLNDTLEISPIKSLSPIREKKSPSPEISNDYVVIQLSSPVQSNGEPFEKCDSPEIFTGDKTSPDKRNQSPPRQDAVINNPSPSSSLSLKKNRPQVRSGGRAAQMLGLCVPDKIQTIINSERFVESEEPKKCSFLSTPARRNLRILYNSVSDINDNADENEDSENFLKFKRSLPTADCSPSCPILKRKLSEIVDDSTLSPANKRKRVSFHDPPVSTTISVQKYIEPCGIRSPQNSALKRQERQLRMHTNLKSPRRLDTVFKLDSVLTKTIESFSETDSIVACTDDTEISSSEQTPAVEVVKTSDLNDTDPICPDLLDCKDAIDNIATELSSPGMKMLLIKELEGKIESVADLAKMTELDINRLCIKAPKVKTVKKVLTEYANKRSVKTQGVENVEINEAILKEEIMFLENRGINVEVQTNNVTLETTEMQTITVPSMTMHTQTDLVSKLYSSTQTEESGSQSTEHVINSCLLNRPDFVEKLNKCLEESSRQEIANELSLNALTDLLLKKTTTSHSSIILSKLLELQSGSCSSNAQGVQNELSFLQDYLCNKFDSKSLVLFCSHLLQKIHDKTA